ncbi:tetratricopeptide repeat protein [bacterium]|nr:tetratricopeptide repeat protein [bacterium]
MFIFSKIEFRRNDKIRIALSGVILLSVLYGCGLQKAISDGYKGLTQAVKGQYYLDKRKYRDGMQAFQKEAQTNPEIAETHYYMGRFNLAENHNKKALEHLKRAVTISPEKAKYHFWLGVAYAADKKLNSERKSYLRVLELDKGHVQALTYLGHNQLEKTTYESALKTYNRAIALWPENPSALYNRALILKSLNRTPEERLAWKQYLRVHPSGAMSRQAVVHLNELSDFEYRNQLIGKRTVPLKRIEFETSTSVIKSTSKPTLNFLATLLKSNPGMALHIVTYQKNNKTLAEVRAKRVKKYLNRRPAGVASSRLSVSSFGLSETIKIGKKTFMEHETVKFIANDSAVDRESAGLRTLAQVASAEKRAAVSARNPDLHASATIEFQQMAGWTLRDAKKSGDKESIAGAQGAYDVAVTSAEETVAEALSVSVEAIRAMRHEGMAWGMVANELGVNPGVLSLVQNKRGKRYPNTSYIGSGKRLKLQTEIKLATKRNPKSGLVPGQGLSMADGSKSKGFGL